MHSVVTSQGCSHPGVSRACPYQQHQAPDLPAKWPSLIHRPHVTSGSGHASENRRTTLPSLRAMTCFGAAAASAPAATGFPAIAAARLGLPPPPGSPWVRRITHHSASAASTRGSASAATSAAAAAATTDAPSAAGRQSAATSGASSSGGGGGGSGSGSDVPLPSRLQQVDYSALAASCWELREGWLPAKVEQVAMPDKTSLCLRLRTPSDQGWLRVSWHQAAGRLNMMPHGSLPERGNASELYSLGEQVRDALVGLVLVGVRLPAAWERVAQLQFGVRPGESPTHHLYCEVMARYSNVILTGAADEVLAVAYQVGGMMSSHRQVQVGRTYALPPQLFGVTPTAVTSLPEWRDTLVRAAALAAAQQREVAEQRRAAAAAKQKLRGGGGGAAAAAAAAGAMAEVTAAAVAAAEPPAGTSNGGGDGGGRLADGFIRAFHGVSPSLVDELCRTAGVRTDVSPGALGSAEWEALYGEWAAWQERLRSGTFAATSDPDTGRYSVFGSLPHRHPSVHAMLEDYYGPLTAAEAHGQLHGKLAAVVAAALKKARGKTRAFEQQLAESDRSEEVQRQADLITANLYRIPAGSSSAEVEDWDTGEPLILQLDATKPPVASATALYRKARKLRRAVDAVQPLVEEIRADVAYLEEVEVGLVGLKRWTGDAADLTALREVQDELVAGKYMKPPPDAALAQKTAARASKAAAKAAKGGSGKKGVKGGGAGGPAGEVATAADGGQDAASARRYTSPGGFTVLVGRNNKQNDVLSTQVAGDDDLWLHVRGMPGSHTLLRVPAGSAPGDDDVQFAADLAAFFSRARDSLKADVVLSKGAWVRKPRGAKPGAVMVTRELRNVVGRPGDCPAAAAAAAPTKG